MASKPLAARLRPNKINQFIGQEHLLGSNKPINAMLKNDKIYSIVFWGPPGTGKTTLAKLIAQNLNCEFKQLSAVTASIKDIRAVVEQAKQNKLLNQDTVLFVDEVHRFNKTQQDAFLPYVEDGTLIFIGATTENPSFELNYALLSRVKVFTLYRLTPEDLNRVLTRALQDPDNGYNNSIQIETKTRELLLNLADGDARRLLTRLEWLVSLVQSDPEFCQTKTITIQHIELLSKGEPLKFDKNGDSFYDLISALHKAIRGSDPDASLYWFCRMLKSGCDPLYLARRLTRIASEDIGNADPRALRICLDAWETQTRLGSPEGELALAQAVVYLSIAAKSNAVYMAFKKASKAAEQYGSLDVPYHLRNAPTNLMKTLGYSKNYRYAHDEPHAYAAGENYFPLEMPREKYYKPTERGLEIQIKKKLEYLKSLDEAEL